MKLNESIGRFSVRKAVRFSIKKLYSRAECFDDLLSEDEARAAALNTVKAAIEAEHLMMVRRVFKTLPDHSPRPWQSGGRSKRTQNTARCPDAPSAANRT